MEKENIRFRQALDFLHNRTNYENFVKIPYDRLCLNKDRLEKFLDYLDRPDQKMKIVHVAGTKGKGSVSMMLEKVLRSYGIRTGLFTSPHLYSVLERFEINGNKCSEYEFADVLFNLKDRLQRFSSGYPELRLEEEPFTFFEWSVLIALELFARQKTEVAVMEVGLGGRFDATNICDTDVSVITSISYDHMEYLGQTLEEIASEKAGIIRRGTPIVSGIGSSLLFPQNAACPQHFITLKDIESVRSVIRRKAEKENAELDQILEISPETKGLDLPFYGEHQQWNFEIVRHVMNILRPTLLEILSSRSSQTDRDSADTDWSAAKMAGFLSGLRLPARMEKVCCDPLVFIDGAHNRASAAALTQSLRDYVNRNKITGKKTLLFAVSAGKDIDGMTAEFETFFDEMIVTAYQSSIRAIPSDELVRQVRKTSGAAITVRGVSDFKEYLKEYCRKNKGQNALCCVAGSFYFASEAAVLIKNMNKADKN